MFCENCGNELGTIARFCKECGSPTSYNASTKEEMKEAALALRLLMSSGNVPEKNGKLLLNAMNIICDFGEVLGKTSSMYLEEMLPRSKKTIEDALYFCLEILPLLKLSTKHKSALKNQFGALLVFLEDYTDVPGGLKLSEEMHEMISIKQKPNKGSEEKQHQQKWGGSAKKEKNWPRKIETRDEALRLIKDASDKFYVFAAFYLAVGFFWNAAHALEGVVFAICSFLLRKFNSRVVAVILFFGTVVFEIVNGIVFRAVSIVLTAMLIVINVQAIRATFVLRKFQQDSTVGANTKEHDPLLRRCAWPLFLLVVVGSFIWLEAELRSLSAPPSSPVPPTVTNNSFTQVPSIPPMEQIEPAHTSQYLYVTGLGVNLREGPGLVYPVIKVIEINTAVEQLETVNNWVKIRTNPFEDSLREALKEGYSKDEIFNYLKTGSRWSQKIQTALEDGRSQEEIFNSLMQESTIIGWINKEYLSDSPLSSVGVARKYFSLAKQFFNREKYEKAVDSYKKGLLFDPNNAGAFNNLGVAYSKVGMLQKAEECFRKASELDPEEKLYKDNLLRIIPSPPGATPDSMKETDI